MKLPVFKAVAMTFAFLAASVLDLVQIVWLPLAVMIAFSTLLMPFMKDGVTSMMTSSPGGAPTEEELRALTAMGPFFTAMFVVSIAFYLIVFAGILKLVIRGEKPARPFYIGFGEDEGRLLGTWALGFLIFMGGYLGFAVALLLAALATMAAPAAGIVVLPVAGIAAMVGFGWLMLRMSLASPATIGQRTIGLGPSWNVAKGNVWRLFVYWLIWGVIFMVLEVVMIAVQMPGYFEAIGDVISAAGSGSPESAQEAMQKMNEASLSMYDGSLGAFARLAGSAVIGTIAMAILAIAGGVAWRLMTETSPEKHFE